MTVKPYMALLLILALAAAMPMQLLAEPSPAEDDAELAQLKQQMSAMADRINAIEARKQMTTDAALERRVRELEERMTERAVDEPPFSAGWKEGFMLQSTDGQHVLKIGGVIQLDGYWHAGSRGIRDTTFDTFTMKRVRFLFSGQVYKHFQFFVQTMWDQGETDLKDAYLDIVYFQPVNLRVGRFTAPMGHENLDDGWLLHLMERSLMANLLADREIGIMFHGTPMDLLEYQLAWVNGADANATDLDDEKTVIGRLLFTPFGNVESRWLNEFGVGGWFSWGRLEDFPAPAGAAAAWGTTSGTTFFAWEPGVVVDGDRFRYGAELLWYGGPFHLNAEYTRMEQDVSVPGALPQRFVTAVGWYVQAGMVLTLEDATPDGPVPRNRFDPRNGKWGAFELVGRVSGVEIDEDVVDMGYAAGTDEATAWAIGLNWYLNENVRAVLQYEHVEFGDDIVADSGSDTEDAVMFRFQLTF